MFARARIEASTRKTGGEVFCAEDRVDFAIASVMVPILRERALGI